MLNLILAHTDIPALLGMASLALFAGFLAGMLFERMRSKSCDRATQTDEVHHDRS